MHFPGLQKCILLQAAFSRHPEHILLAWRQGKAECIWLVGGGLFAFSKPFQMHFACRRAWGTRFPRFPKKMHLASGRGKAEECVCKDLLIVSN